MAGQDGRLVIFDGSSAQSSTYTSTMTSFIGDAYALSLSWNTDGTAASKLTVQGSNDDGFQASVTTWSTITTIVLAGTHNLDDVALGARWARFQRNSNESLSEVVLNQQR